MARRRVSDVAAAADTTEPEQKREYKYAVKRKCEKISLDVIEHFCRLIAGGKPATTACDYIGIRDTTFQAWRRKGEMVLAGQGADIEQADLYEIFVCAHRRATAEWLIARIDSAQQRGNRNWFRDIKMLQLRDRANWAYDAQGGQEEVFEANETFL